jgi:hypothetical protein
MTIENEPRFDFVTDARINICSGGWTQNLVAHLVVHVGVDGLPYAYHSPLNRGPISCAVCESGERIYLPKAGLQVEGDEHDA